MALVFTISTTQAVEPVKNAPGTSTITGKVASSGNEVPFATIFLQGTTIGTSADLSGNFILSGIPSGRQIMLFSAVGFKQVQKEVYLEPGKSVQMMIELLPDNIGIEQIVISANRNGNNRRRASTIVNTINPNLFERIQGTTLSEGLNFTPGLRMENNCQNCGFSQVRMNGLEGPYSQILINSRPVFSGLAGVYGLELIPVNMIERVEVIRGGGSALYGSNAIAGTINLITKDPINNQYSISMSSGITGVGLTPDRQPDYNLTANGSLVSKTNTNGISFYGFHRQRDPYDANMDGFSELSSIDNTTIGTRLFQRTGNRGKISLDLFKIYEYRRGGNLFDLPLHEADIAESTTHNIHSGSLTFDQLYRESDKISAWFSAVDVSRDSYYGANQDPSGYGITHDISLSAGIQYVHTFRNLLFAPASVTSGIEWSGNRLRDKKLGYFDPETNLDTGNTPVAHQGIQTGSLFTQSDWDLNPLLVSVGLRYDHYRINDLLNQSEVIPGDVLSPRISLLWHANTNLQFRTAFARGFRAPQIFDEDLHIETSGARQVLHQNDENLKQETSNSLTASVNYTIQSLFWQYQFLAEGFITRLKDPFANEYGLPDENGVVIYTRMNAREGAEVKGINLEFNASPNRRLQFQTGLTLQQSKYEDPQQFNERRFFRSPGHYGYATFSWNPVPAFSVSATGNYTGKMLIPYFGPRIQDPDLGVLVTTDPFWDTGFRLSYDFKLSRLVKMQLNGGIKNILNSYQNDFDTGINRDPAYFLD